MRSGDGDQREARADIQMTVSSRPPSPPDNATPIFEPPTTSTPGGGSHLSPRPHWRTSIMAAIAGFIVVTTLLILFTDTGHTTAGTTTPRVRPTATVTPSPTATVIPSPTAMYGFKVYTDLPDSFVLQYPTRWVYQPIEPNLGVEFDDSGSNNGNFSLQIITPTSGCASNADDPSAWVQCAIDQLAKNGSVQQETGPIPARVIGGQVWQSGIARVTAEGIVIRVDIYATIHDGRPYIITVAGLDDQFSPGSKLYFEPMLSSFQFLPPTP